jgi:hypothetical protein
MWYVASTRWVGAYLRRKGPIGNIDMCLSCTAKDSMIGAELDGVVIAGCLGAPVPAARWRKRRRGHYKRDLPGRYHGLDPCREGKATATMADDTVEDTVGIELRVVDGDAVRLHLKVASSYPGCTGESSPEEEAAAVRIQAAARGRATRKGLVSQRATTSSPDDSVPPVTATAEGPPLPPIRPRCVAVRAAFMVDDAVGATVAVGPHGDTTVALQVTASRIRVVLDVVHSSPIVPTHARGMDEHRVAPTDGGRGRVQQGDDEVGAVAH